jgi:hypothetical protein
MAGDMKTARSAECRLLSANPDFTIKGYLAILSGTCLPQW